MCMGHCIDKIQCRIGMHVICFGICDWLNIIHVMPEWSHSSDVCYHEVYHITLCINSFTHKHACIYTMGL